MIDVSPIAAKYLFRAFTIASVLIEELPPTVDEFQSVVGYLALLDANVPKLSSTVFSQAKKFNPRLLTENFVQCLPLPSKLIQLLDEVRLEEKKRTERGRPTGFTFAYRELRKLNKVKKNKMKA